MPLIIAERVGSKQARIEFANGALKIIVGEVDELLGEAIQTEPPLVIKLWGEPFDLVGAKKEDPQAPHVVQLAQAIIDKKYPTYSQKEFLSRIAGGENLARQQACLRFCHESKCVCAMFYSCGCADFIEAEIKGRRYTHKPRTAVAASESKFGRALSEALRNIGTDEAEGALDEIDSIWKEERDQFRMARYGRRT